MLIITSTKKLGSLYLLLISFFPGFSINLCLLLHFVDGYDGSEVIRTDHAYFRPKWIARSSEPLDLLSSYDM